MEITKNSRSRKRDRLLIVFIDEIGFDLVAPVAAASVITAGMTLAVTVVTAHDIRIVVQLTGEEGRNCFICTACDTAVQLNASLIERHLRTAADAAADQCVNLIGCEKAGECAVSAAVGVDNPGRRDRAALYVVKFKLCRVSKMLEHLPVLISNCNSHRNISFFING